MPQKLIKRILQTQVWAIKKKSVVQVLTPRCRRDGEPEYGRFTTTDIERTIQHTKLILLELIPYFKDLPNHGNYMMAYSSMIDLAIYRALLLSIEKEADCTEDEGSSGAHGNVPG